jgi:hypothetical protein
VTLLTIVGYCIVGRKGTEDGRPRTTYVEECEFQKMDQEPVYEFLHGMSEASRNNSLKETPHYKSMKNIYRAKYSRSPMKHQTSGFADRKSSAD